MLNQPLLFCKIISLNHLLLQIYLKLKLLLILALKHFLCFLQNFLQVLTSSVDNCLNCESQGSSSITLTSSSLFVALSNFLQWRPVQTSFSCCTRSASENPFGNVSAGSRKLGFSCMFLWLCTRYSSIIKSSCFLKWNCFSSATAFW